MKSTIKTDVLIIGAGLTGLMIGASLIKKGKSIKILESRSRLGGRIQTLGYSKNNPVEMGATWLGKKHLHLNEVLSDLGIETFKQTIGDQAFFEPLSTSPPVLASVPKNDEPSLRIKGGSYKVIDVLASEIGLDKIECNQKVRSVHLIDNSIQIKTHDKDYIALQVISTLPPKLLVSSIDITPSFDDQLIAIANSTHTWMGESIKVALTYPKPFWREKHFSGTIFSNVGPVHEMYDHCNYELSHFSLMGFYDGNYFNLKKEQRLKKLIDQLRKYYGSHVDGFIEYNETVWRKEEDSFIDYETHIVPHQNNGHPIYSRAQLQNRFIIAGTETAGIYPGYMEGAIYSAKTAIDLIMKMEC